MLFKPVGVHRIEMIEPSPESIFASMLRLCIGFERNEWQALILPRYHEVLEGGVSFVAGDFLDPKMAQSCKQEGFEKRTIAG